MFSQESFISEKDEDEANLLEKEEIQNKMKSKPNETRSVQRTLMCLIIVIQ